MSDDAEPVAAALREHVARLAFAGLTAEQVTARLIDHVAGFAAARGWRVYRRAPSVLPLPPPLQDRHSVVDLAFARPGAPPVVVEVDRAQRRRTLDKLLAEAAAGRIAVWLRWGTGGFAAPPPPVRLVGCPVLRHGGHFTRVADAGLPPPRHSGRGAGPDPTSTLPSL